MLAVVAVELIIMRVLSINRVVTVAVVREVMQAAHQIPLALLILAVEAEVAAGT
jgi:hypothetical protein